jgi:hypothetical protein
MALSDIETVLLIFCLLQLKHFAADFVLQTPRMIYEKGTYGASHGIYHSLVHAGGTLIAFVWLHPIIGVVTAFFDFLLHYHIDWAKSNINNKYKYTQDNPKFWVWFGADQLAHQFTYIVLIWWIFFGL